MARYFHRVIPGTGQTANQRVLLRRLVNNAVMLIGKKDEAGVQQDLEDAVSDIAAALLGKEVEFGETLPYPGTVPNGIKKGTSHLVDEEKLFDGLPEVIKFEDLNGKKTDEDPFYPSPAW